MACPMPVDAPVTKTASLAMHLSLVNDDGVAFGVGPRSHETVRRLEDLAQLHIATAQFSRLCTSVGNREHHESARRRIGQAPDAKRRSVGKFELAAPSRRDGGGREAKDVAIKRNRSLGVRGEKSGDIDTVDRG